MEAVLPFVFPHGSGSPKAKCTTAMLFKSCIQRYLWFVMFQFMRADVVLVHHQLFLHQISFKRGIWPAESLWGQFQKNSLSVYFKRLWKFPIKGWTSNKQQRRIYFLKSITAKCKSLGHATEITRCKKISVHDDGSCQSELYISYNNPNDEWSFWVRLYADTNNGGCQNIVCFW